MYSRYHDRPDRPIRLPENYGGCAFSEREASSETEPRGGERAASRRLEVGRPTPPPRIADDFSVLASEEKRVEMPPELPVVTEDEEDGENAPPSGDSPVNAFLRPLGGLFGNVGRAFPFSHGIGFDEILLIGLILLLSREEQSSELVLWLALLLFCG